MADFPPIEPRVRGYAVTGKPSAIVETGNGRAIGFFQGYRSANRPIDLTFELCTMATVTQILNHYQGEKNWGRFRVPIQSLRTHPSLYTLTPAYQQYKYRAAPSWVRVSPGRFDVTVSLETVF